MVVVIVAVTGLHALCGAGGGGGHCPVVPIIMVQGRDGLRLCFITARAFPDNSSRCLTGSRRFGLLYCKVMAQFVNRLRPLFGMLRVDSAVIALKALKGAFVRFAAGGSAGSGGFIHQLFLAKVLAMDDLLQFIIVVGIPQLRIIANGIYKAACCGVTSFAYLSLNLIPSIVFYLDILVIRPSRLLHFKQHIVADFDLGGGNRTLASNYCTVLAELNFSVSSAVNVHFNFSARTPVEIPAADTGGSCSRSCIDGGIVLYIDLHISIVTSDRNRIIATCRLDGHMALNGDIGIAPAIANGRAGEPSCYDMDIFRRCCSPGRANGHLCLGEISTVPSSADGSTIIS